jgi:hypothetical protein
MMNLHEIEARLEIQDTLARYVRWADAGRTGEFAGLFTEDCIYDILGCEHRGRAAVAAFFEGKKKAFVEHYGGARIRHHMSSIVIELLGPTEAHASAYFMAVGPNGPDHWGNYRDRLKRVGDRWLFAERHVQVAGRVDGCVVG